MKRFCFLHIWPAPQTRDMPYVWDSAKVDNYEELFEDFKKLLLLLFKALQGLGKSSVKERYNKYMG
jgi:hypothetical protein